MLTREAIVNSAETFKIRKVMTPGWNLDGGDPAESYVYVRTVGANRAREVHELAEQEDNTDGQDQDALSFARWCVLGVCDDKGEPFFQDDDIPALLLRPLIPLVECANAVMEFNGVSIAARDEQKKD